MCPKQALPICVVLYLLAFFAHSSLAQRAAAGPGAERFFETAITAGVWLVLGMASGCLALKLGGALRGQRFAPRSVACKLDEMIREGQPARAKRMACYSGTVLGRLLSRGLSESGAGPQQAAAGVSAAAEEEETRLSLDIDMLTALAAAASSCGLLGTVVGLIDGFATLSVTHRPGVWAFAVRSLPRAMDATRAGLMIAVPTLAVHALFRRRLNLLMLHTRAAARAILRCPVAVRPDTIPREEGCHESVHGEPGAAAADDVDDRHCVFAADFLHCDAADTAR